MRDRIGLEIIGVERVGSDLRIDAMPAPAGRYPGEGEPD
jgi:hypothetical protein